METWPTIFWGHFLQPNLWWYFKRFCFFFTCFTISAISNYLKIDAFNPIPTRLCHVKYCHSDKSHPCLVGQGLNITLLSNKYVLRYFDLVGTPEPSTLNFSTLHLILSICQLRKGFTYSRLILWPHSVLTATTAMCRVITVSLGTSIKDVTF